MDASTRRLIGASAILAPALHTLTDVIEWAQGGFSPMQLWLNYLAFVPVPAIVLGLYAVQRPAISRRGLWGALLYGFAFVFFAFTTLVAITDGIATYEELWSGLGSLYTAHGAVMVVGGAVFAGETLRARVFPKWTAGCLLVGLGVNLVLALVPAPDLFQTVGTLFRNVGLAGMGWASWTSGRTRAA